MANRLCLFAVLLLLLTGCSKPQPPGPALNDWVPAAEGAVVAWNSLPDAVRQIARDGDRSADGRWVAARIPSVSGRLPQVWVAATDQTTACLVQPDPPTYDSGLWSPSGTYLYDSNPDDAWREVDPASGKVQPFLPQGAHGAEGRKPALFPRRAAAPAHWEGNRVVLSPAGFYPEDVRTGLPAVDRVIEALAQNDGDRLYGLIKMSRVACTTRPSGTGELPCPPGTPDGTRLAVFPTGSCEPNFVPEGDLLRGLFHDWAAQATAVYAVYRDKPAQPGDAAAGYAIVVAEPKEPFRARAMVLDAKGAIVQVYSCAGPTNMLPSGADFVLPPKLPAPG